MQTSFFGQLTARPSWLTNPSNKLERHFARFHDLNPHVYLEFERRALEAHSAGARRIGVKAIAERIRWDIHTRTLGDKYKVNNSLVALYARLLLFRRPELADLIELREHTGKRSADVLHGSTLKGGGAFNTGIYFQDSRT